MAPTTGVANAREVQRLIPVFPEVNFTFWSLGDYAMAELLEKLRVLKEDSFVLLVTAARDQTGQTFSYNESMPMISRASSAPIFIVHDTRLPFGMVGGKLISGFQQGKTAAEINFAGLAGGSD